MTEEKRSRNYDEAELVEQLNLETRNKTNNKEYNLFDQLHECIITNVIQPVGYFTKGVTKKSGNTLTYTTEFTLNKRVTLEFTLEKLDKGTEQYSCTFMFKFKGVKIYESSVIINRFEDTGYTFDEWVYYVYSLFDTFMFKAKKIRELIDKHESATRITEWVKKFNQRRGIA